MLAMTARATFYGFIIVEFVTFYESINIADNLTEQLSKARYDDV